MKTSKCLKGDHIYEDSGIIAAETFGKSVDTASNTEIYYALLSICAGNGKRKRSSGYKKKIYYISAEFLLENCFLIT